MKILAIGDFHGKFPTRLKKESKKVDLIVSIGDYCPFFYRKIWFKHCYGKDMELWEIIGKKKYKEWIKKDLKFGEKILKKLNNLSVPVITVVGNSDYTRIIDILDKKKKKRWKWDEQDFFSKIIKKYKNIKRFDYSFVRFKNYIFIGAFGRTSPGKVKSKNYKRYRKKLDNLFKKFKKENEQNKVIFVSHNVPYGILDGIKSNKIDEKLKREHYGTKLIRRIIDKYQPFLAVAGHMHENQGKAKIEKTLIVNPGAAYEGKAAIITVDTGKIKNIKFLK